MNRENTLQMLGHYVGNHMLTARGYTWEKNDVKAVDADRLKLLKDLRTLDRIPEVDACVAYLETAHWETAEDIASFQERYETINKQAQNMGDAVSKLFGNRKSGP